MELCARWDQAHFDGGASILAAGLGVWGRRTLLLHAAPASPDKKGTPPPENFQRSRDNAHALVQTPGDFYIGGLAQAWHQVRHEEGEAEPNEVLQVRGKMYKVAVMLRTSAFGAARARAPSTPPGPTAVFKIVSAVIHDALQETKLKMPTLEQCLAAAADQ